MNLTKLQKLAIELLAHSPLRNIFYWTGGTLLASHYLHHRESIDLDFFSEKKFSLEEINRFTQELKEKGGFATVHYQKIFDRYEFLFENEEHLRIEFVYYNHEKKTLRKRELLNGVHIDSLDDIAANKVMAYFDRNEPKDLFDIYFLIHKSGFNPLKLLKLVKQKFGISFNEASFWSEAFKCFPLLHTLKPLMLQKEEDKQKQLLKTIEDYFQEGSARFLHKNLE
ncbi:nucleotidyl transferase AbiEii/AbiGii toxin family protein [Candidatus Daviesbacteria bacterium]|nr:nucleotidyl transferase AbiEii/AbiGii toxin family protein [Candidatus Daviesbacteria bacterium]